MKVFFAKLSVLTSMLLLYGATSVWAQGKGKISFSGTVQASETEGEAVRKPIRIVNSLFG